MSQHQSALEHGQLRYFHGFSFGIGWVF